MSKRIRWRVLLIVLVVAGLVAGYVATGYSHAQKEWLGPGSPPLSEALKKGMEVKAVEFVKQGAEIYQRG